MSSRDRFDSFNKVVVAVATLITAITGAASVGHTIGWW